jgi:hypothetical protein
LLYNSINSFREEVAAKMMPPDPMWVDEPTEEPETLPWIDAVPEGVSITYVDQNHDGYPDHFRWQLPWTPAEGLPLHDSNLNGIPDSNTVYVDMDGDGVPDTHLNPMDLNHDGSVDHLVGYTDLPLYSPLYDVILRPGYPTWHAPELDWQHGSDYAHDNLVGGEPDPFDLPFGIGD